MRHGTQDPTRATVASNCIPCTKSCGTSSRTEGDQTGASQAQEQDERKERQRGMTALLRTNGQPQQRLKDSKAGHKRWRADATPTTLTDKDDDSSRQNDSKDRPLLTHQLCPPFPL